MKTFIRRFALVRLFWCIRPEPKPATLKAALSIVPSAKHVPWALPANVPFSNEVSVIVTCWPGRPIFAPTKSHASAAARRRRRTRGCFGRRSSRERAFVIFCCSRARRRRSLRIVLLRRLFRLLLPGVDGEEDFACTLLDGTLAEPRVSGSAVSSA